MPILPIDLQTMFSHMNQVGKDQAVLKEGTPQHQAIQAQEIIQKTNTKDHSVNETEEIGEGVETVKDNEKEAGAGGSGGKKKKKKKEESEEKRTVVYQDPNLGRHIDITG